MPVDRRFRDRDRSRGPSQVEPTLFCNSKAEVGSEKKDDETPRNAIASSRPHSIGTVWHYNPKLPDHELQGGEFAVAFD